MIVAPASEEVTVGGLIEVSILVNAEPVDALSMVVHRSNSETRGRQVCERLKDLHGEHHPRG